MFEAQLRGMLLETLDLFINSNDRSSDFINCVLAWLLDLDGAFGLSENPAGAEKVARIAKRLELVTQHPSKYSPPTLPKGNLRAEFKVATPNLPAAVLCAVHELRFLII
jgi:hypothetical protein